jgi:glycosyltransferase involved in cell wall biosynthesis
MLLSVFTPTHTARYLDNCYGSLASQTFAEWEWIVMLNGKAPDWRPPTDDDRVRVLRSEDVGGGVGAAKAVACEAATGEVLVEFDHDDVLLPDCLRAVAEVFSENPDAALVYSDFAQVNDDLSPNEDRFNAANGWEYSPEANAGRTYLRCHSMAPLPHNVGYIWYAPNHVRAFSNAAYHRVGGYNRSLTVLDDQELMMRLFLDGDFVHIDRLLYLQRMHPKNTQRDPELNAFIQQQTVAYYREQCEALHAAWCRRHGLRILGLRTPTSPELGTIEGEETIVLDPDTPVIDAADESVGLIRCIELLQRVPDRAALFNECYRVGAHGAMVRTSTPSTDGRGAFQDPSHVALYNENSFWYLTQAARRASIPDLRARLQVGYVGTIFPSDFYRDADIPFVEANLLVVKDGPRLGGPLLC